MICLTCAEVVKGSARFCLRCGNELVTPSHHNLKRFGDERVRARLVEWRRDGLLPDELGERLQATLPPPPAPRPKPAPPAPQPTAPGRPRPSEPSPDSVPPGLTSGVEGPPARQPPPSPTAYALDASSSSAALVNASSGATGAVGGVDAFAALDEEPVKHGSKAFALQAEYVWWFVGTLLVLGGSVMGVREAWLALGGAWRQLLVAGALFTYHAGFVGMAALVGRRSPSAGKVLSAVALGLLPVVFVALASLVGDAPWLGLLAAAALTVGVVFTLSITAGRFEAMTSFGLWVTLLPALEAELVVGAWPQASWLRLVVPLIGVAVVWWTMRSHFSGAAVAAPGGALLGVSVFGALALLAVDVLGAAATSDGLSGFDAIAPGSVPLATLLLGGLLVCALLAETATTAAARATLPRAAGVLEVLFFAATAALALGIALPLFTAGVPVDRAVGLTSVVTVVAAALLVGRLEERRPQVLHLALALGAVSTALVAALARPAEPAWWAFGAAVMAPVTMSLAGSAGGLRRRLLLGWSVALGIGAFVTAGFLDPGGALAGGLPPTTATALLVGGFAHLSAGRRVHPLHWYGGASLVAALASWAWFAPGSNAAVFGAGLAVLAVGYRLVALGFDVIGTRSDEDRDLAPFDDVALLSALASLVVFVLGGLLPGRAGVTLSAPTWEGGWAWAPVLVALSALLGARRDASRAVGLLAVWGIDLALLSALQATSSAKVALVHAGTALGAVGLAHLLRPAERGERPRARALFSLIPLPLRGAGRALYADACAFGALTVAPLGALGLFDWLGARVEADRVLGIEAGAVLVLAAVAAFFSKGFDRPRARGATTTLFVAGAFIGLTAVVNRVGRPLPPEVVGRNLTLIALGLWLFAWLLQAQGPRLAKALDHEAAGKHYRQVPLVGMLVLAVVLTVDAFLLGAPVLTGGWLRTPPLFFLGAALIATLLSRAWNATPLLDAALVLALPGAALVSVQRALLGPALEAVPGVVGFFVLPGQAAACAGAGNWTDACLVPASAAPLEVWNAATLGVALAASAYSALAVFTARGGLALVVQREAPRPLVVANALEPLRRWAFGGAVVVGMVALVQTSVPPAALVLSGGFLLLFAHDRHVAARQLALGAVLVVHAVATGQPLLPPWAGPALAALSLLPSLPFLATTPPERATPRRFAVLALLVLAQVYALAVSTPAVPVGVALNVLNGAVTALGSGAFLLSTAVPATLALSAVGLLFVTLHRKDDGAAVLGAFVGPVAALAGTMGLVHAALGGAQWLGAVPGEVVAARGALALSLGAAFAHVGAWWLTGLSRAKAAKGVRFGRDLLFTGLSLWVALFASYASQLPGQRLFETSVVALGLAVGVAVHAAWSEQTSRHVYFVEGAVLGLYAVARSQVLVQVTPEMDALLVLGLGFFLVGVTVMARRFGAPPVATATRRFTAVLPLLVPILLGGRITETTLFAAVGSSALYGTMAAVEQSKWLGSLAAAAANVALLVWMLRLGLDGAEVYLAPLGLLVMALGHLFSKDLAHGSRNALRVVGGLLLYVPAGLNVTLQLAQGADGIYSVAFGAVCLFGILAGVGLQIRAYLALGTLFLVLEVLTTLAYASVRDHRIAFLVLSVAGLFILGTMIGVTLKREAFSAALGRVRGQLRGWD